MTEEELRASGLPCDMLVQVTNAYHTMRDYDPSKITQVQGLTLRNLYASSAKAGLYMHPLYAKDFTEIVIDGVQIDDCDSPLCLHAGVDLRNYTAEGKKVAAHDNYINFRFSRTVNTLDKLLERIKERDAKPLR